MPLFARRKLTQAQSFLLKLVNNHCAELQALAEGPRGERRARLTMVVMVIPIVRNTPVLKHAFAAITKEFSTVGLSLVVDNPRPLDEVILGFRWEADMKFIRARAVHLSPMGAGFFQIGMRAIEVVPEGDFPELADVHF